MTLNEWIKEYCEDNNIELPDDIKDNYTALKLIKLIEGGE